MTRLVTISVPDDHLVDAASFYGCPVVANVVVPDDRPLTRAELVAACLAGTIEPATDAEMQGL